MLNEAAVRPADIRLRLLVLFAAISCFLCVTALWAQRRPREASASRSQPILLENEIDQALQQTAAEALGGREGAILVMNPQDGRLRAVVNPHLAFGAASAPASTIKPFVALTALRTKRMGGSSRLLCRADGDDPYTRDAQAAGRRIHFNCAHSETLAPFDMRHALAYSCNYYFARLGEKLDAEEFNRTLLAFNLVARVNNSRARAGSSPQRGLSADDALGEGNEMRVTPVQLIAAYAALVNGGHLYAPRLAAADFTSKEQRTLEIAPAHRATLIDGMRGAITYGTAQRAALDELPLYVFGKTGTTTGDPSSSHGWFVGFASEKGASPDDPKKIKLAVLVFLRRAHGAECAEVARSVFAEFAERWKAYDMKAERESEDAPEGEASSLPARRTSSLPTSSVRVRLVRESETRTLDLENYVLGVVAAEGSVENQPEALKALAITARTFARKNLERHKEEGYDFCSTTHCQRFVSIDPRGASELARRAVAETAGEVLRDERGDVADVYFHAACGGHTANIETLWGAQHAPRHLRGARDDYCAARPNRSWTDVVTSAELLRALRADERSDMGARLDNVIVVKRDATNRAELVRLEGERVRNVRGWDFKLIVGRALGWNVLKSSRFEVRRVGANFVFRGFGFGHGLGLCQEGAHVMAERAASYRRILDHYFPGTAVMNTNVSPRAEDAGARELKGATTRRWVTDTPDRVDAESQVINGAREAHGAWRVDVLLPRTAFEGRNVFEDSPHAQRSSRAEFSAGYGRSPSEDARLSLAGEHFRVSYPARVERREIEDVLRALEAARADVLRRISAASLSPAPLPTLEIIFHRTTADFIRATGQPGWAAAATRGPRTELQPLGVLRRRGVLAATLRHEYVHAVVEQLGRGQTPRWLAEGLAIHVAGEGGMLARLGGQIELPGDELGRRLSRRVSASEMRAAYAAAYFKVRQIIQAEGEKGVWRLVAHGRP